MSGKADSLIGNRAAIEGCSGVLGESCDRVLISGAGDQDSYPVLRAGMRAPWQHGHGQYPRRGYRKADVSRGKSGVLLRQMSVGDDAARGAGRGLQGVDVASDRLPVLRQDVDLLRHPLPLA